MISITLLTGLLIGFAIPQDDEGALPRTYTQKDWGGKCGRKGVEDAGCLREEHFASLFPRGLVIGDADGPDGDEQFALVLTSAEAVAAFLPKDGDPKMLGADLTDPNKSKGTGGAFAGHLVAAKLNVAANDAGLIQGAAGSLGVMQLTGGRGLAGLSVNEVLRLADEAIAGGTDARMKDALLDVDGDGEADVSAQDLFVALKGINGSFENGRDRGVLQPAPRAVASTAGGAGTTGRTAGGVAGRTAGGAGPGVAGGDTGGRDASGAEAPTAGGGDRDGGIEGRTGEPMERRERRQREAEERRRGEETERDDDRDDDERDDDERDDDERGDDRVREGGVVTYNHGGWGQDCQGNNVGCLRDEHFARVFPRGLVIGDPDGVDGDGEHALVLTDSAAVAAFLPHGGPSETLAADDRDPGRGVGRGMGGSLTGQLVAARINLAYADAGVLGSGELGDLVFTDCVTDGLMGLSVREVVALADEALSGRHGFVSDPSQQDRRIVDVDGDGRGDVSLADLTKALERINKAGDDDQCFGGREAEDDDGPGRGRGKAKGWEKNKDKLKGWEKNKDKGKGRGR